jgi:uncharacterized protein (TIGR02246 family)
MRLKALHSVFTASFLLGLIGLSACKSEQSAAPSEQEDIAAITAVSKERADGFNQGNSAAIAAHFAEDALLMAPDKPTLKGKAAVQEYYQHIFDEYKTALKSDYEEVKISGDMAYGRGFAEVLLTPKTGGQAVRSTAKYINIMKRRTDGRWTTTHDIWNANELPAKQ